MIYIRQLLVGVIAILLLVACSEANEERKLPRSWIADCQYHEVPAQDYRWTPTPQISIEA